MQRDERIQMNCDAWKLAQAIMDEVETTSRVWELAHELSGVLNAMDPRLEAVNS